MYRVCVGILWVAVVVCGVSEARTDSLDDDPDYYAVAGAICHKARLAAQPTLVEARQCAFFDAAYAAKRSDFAECAAAYADYVKQYPSDSRIDEALYNGGVCYEKSNQLRDATTAYRTLEKQFPSSVRVAAALLRIGRVQERQQDLAAAAVSLGSFARRFPQHAEASFALRDAIAHNHALGDSRSEVANTKLLLQMAGRDLQAAEEAHYSLVAIYASEDRVDQQVEYLTSYLATYQDVAPTKRFADAYATLGRLVWQQSCPVPLVDGLCATPLPMEKLRDGETPKTCAAVWATSRRRQAALPRGPVAIRGRKGSKVRHLQRIFARAATQADDVAAQSRAMQALLFVDDELESLLSTRLPSGLDFSPDNPRVARQSVRRFQGWLGTLVSGDAAIRAKYLAVTDLRDVETSVVAVTRVSPEKNLLTRAIGRLAIPASVRTNPADARSFCQLIDWKLSSQRGAAREPFPSCASSTVGSSGPCVVERGLYSVPELLAAPSAVARQALLALAPPQACIP